MLHLSASTVFARDGANPLIGLSDLDLLLFQGQWHLFATERAGASITSFHEMDWAAPGQVDGTQYITGGTAPAEALDIVRIGSDHFAVLSGPSHTGYAAYDVAITGQIGDALTFLPASGWNSALTAFATATLADGMMILTAQWGQAGFTVQSIASNLETTHVQSVNVGANIIADLATTQIADATIVVAADASDNQVRSYRMASDGSLTPADTVGAVDGLGLNAPGIMRVVSVAGREFGLLAAHGSSSISVFEIDQNGEMLAKDHVIDGLGTRFAAISELEVVDHDGRSFVLAAGSDDGISLLELLPGGRLLHHVTLEDTVDFPLQNVSGLAGKVHGGVLHVYAGSASESGLVELEFDLGVPGQVLHGAAWNETLAGSVGDDVLFGGGGPGSDVLYGHAGNDILVAGRGYDELLGGSGADTFVFGGADQGQVSDFDVAQDRLNLSGWQFLYETTQLEFAAHGNRLDISFRGNGVSIFSHDGSTLDAETVAGQIDIYLNHSFIAPPPVDLNQTYFHAGTIGDDTLQGDIGLDIFYASAGADTYFGDDNHDTVIFEGFGAGVKVDLLFPDRNSGAPEDDLLLSIEGITGTEFKDILVGDGAQNWFEGGDGDDILQGRASKDKLFGGAGDDKLNGGQGWDRLEGHEGDDLLEAKIGRDALFGGLGADTLLGGGHDDSLFGGLGHDLLDGEEGADWLEGGYGNDKMTGGSGADVFVFEHGHDVITDFEVGIDLLYLFSTLVPDPSIDAAAILYHYGQNTEDGIVLDFGKTQTGKDQRLVFDGLVELADLTDSLFLL